MPKLSLVIPAHNEETGIVETLEAFHTALRDAGIDHELVVVNDHSSDRTVELIEGLCTTIPQIKLIHNQYQGGFGLAIRSGLEQFSGDYVAIVMADLSDDPADVVTFYKKALEGYECVFGTRFSKGGKALGYPMHKYILNRLTNNIIRVLFGFSYNDTTNAFKLYKREVIENLKPFLSHHFNLTVELPLKSIIRGHSYAVVPNKWNNRKKRKSYLRIKEMGSRYFFIIFYCLLEKWLSQGDYRKH